MAVKNFPNKKAPGKGGHHLVPFYPLTHPRISSEASRTDRRCMVRAWLNLAESQPLLYSHPIDIL